MSLGGLVAAAETSSGIGNTTDYGVWTTGDVTYADQVVACAIEQLKIDPKRIYTAGYSAGALFAVHLWYARSGYIAGVASYSGGTSIINVAPMQDPAHPPAVVAAHGMQGSDVLVLDFADTSAAWIKDVAAKGAFAVDCNDGSSHIDVAKRAAVSGSVWKFFQDHPYGIKPRPYMTLPAGWPTYCKIASP
jgi:poly(3-hydroxybutyrate) depolymerase